MQRLVSAIGLLGLLMAGGCASNGTTTPSDSVDTVEPAETVARHGDSSRLTVNGANFDTLGALVRSVGESTEGGGIVLVSGLEDRPSPTVDIARMSMNSGLLRLLDASGLQVHDGAFYQFVYPRGYEALLEVSVAAALPPRLQNLRASLAVGAGTDMVNALALLSRTLGLTVVADNAIADVWCGEMFVYDAPVHAILDGLLQSARVTQQAFQVECSERSIFLRSRANVSAPDPCLNRSRLTAEEASLLAAPVTVHVPGADDTPRFQRGAAPLKSVVPMLEGQLGLSVTVSPEMEEFPVNQASFFDLPREEMLALFVRQWPIAGYGYTINGSGVHFCASNAL